MGREYSKEEKRRRYEVHRKWVENNKDKYLQSLKTWRAKNPNYIPKSKPFTCMKPGSNASLLTLTASTPLLVAEGDAGDIDGYANWDNELEGEVDYLILTGYPNDLTYHFSPAVDPTGAVLKMNDGRQFKVTKFRKLDVRAYVWRNC